MISEVIIEVCEYYSEGLSPGEIANRMHMSEIFVQDILDQYYEEFMDGGEKYDESTDGSEGD